MKSTPPPGFYGAPGAVVEGVAAARPHAAAVAADIKPGPTPGERPTDRGPDIGGHRALAQADRGRRHDANTTPHEHSQHHAIHTSPLGRLSHRHQADHCAQRWWGRMSASVAWLQ